jgi:predicted transcriptional regulator
MVDIIAAILKVVIRGDGTKRDIEKGAYLSYLQIKQYLPLLLEINLLTKGQEEQTIFKITQKAVRFLHLYDQLNQMIQYPGK